MVPNLPPAPLRLNVVTLAVLAVVATGPALPSHAAPAIPRLVEQSLDQGLHCRRAIQQAESGSGLPQHMLVAIARVESGRRDPISGRFHPWPWTINAGGRGHFFDSKAEAVAYARQLQQRGVRSFDVGCMQVNMMYHPNAFQDLEEAFEPAANARYAVKFLRQLKDKTTLFVVPLGVGAHLRAWGVAPARIRELDWNDSVQVPGLTIVSTPARHFSGRGLTNRNSTSWSSWVLKSASRRVFYSGDGGYSAHFGRIGQQHGPFDLALMECGQYNADWAEIHMLPEQSVQAALDVQARLMLPVHWGAFTEARHAWNEPVRRATTEAARRQLPITTPQLGQPVTLGGVLPQELWWQ